MEIGASSNAAAAAQVSRQVETPAPQQSRETAQLQTTESQSTQAQTPDSSQRVGGQIDTFA